MVSVLVVCSDGDGRADLVQALQIDDGITVVSATDSSDAARAIIEHRPEAVALDVPQPMPQRDVAALVRHLATTAPIPVVVAPHSPTDSTLRMALLRAGAIKVIPRPARWAPENASSFRNALQDVSQHKRARPRPARPATRSRAGAAVIAIAASAGGPPAVAQVIRGLGDTRVPIVVVQHLQAGFAEGFNAVLSRHTSLNVQVATDGASLASGGVFVAPSGLHLQLTPSMRLRLTAEPETLHRPSADVLFASVALAAGRRGIGVVLTGMGSDGAHGLLALREAGGTTLAQDEASSVVYGMARAAGDLGAVQQFFSLENLPEAILLAVKRSEQ
jgi:two-component system chemotaxis response regulator CheB